MATTSAASPVSKVVEFFARAPSREDIVAFRLSQNARERLQWFMARNAAGSSTSAEQQELDQMVLLDDIVSSIRVRAHGSLRAVTNA
jgi:hypothetical protein